MSKRAKATREGIGHGLEYSNQWKIDQILNASRSKKTIWVPLSNSEYKPFKSNVSELRDKNSHGNEASWGYKVSKSPFAPLVSCDGEEYAYFLHKNFDELSTYDEVASRKNPTDNQFYPQVQKRKAPKNQSFMERVTIDVSPEISRALQLDLAKENKTAPLYSELKVKLDWNLKYIVKEFEELHKGSKVVGAAWHILSGQFHCDLWVHACYEKEVEIGKKKKKKKLRLKASETLCHFGPGSGIVAWDRHLKVLGREAKTIAPAVVKEVSTAIERCEKKAVIMDRPDTANRDIKIHRLLDSIVSESLSKESLKLATQQYRNHLKEFYSHAEASARGIDHQWLDQMAKELEQQELHNDLKAEQLQDAELELSTKSSIQEANEEHSKELLHDLREELFKEEANLLIKETTLKLYAEELQEERAQLNHEAVLLAVEQEKLNTREAKEHLKERKAEGFDALASLVKILLPALKSVEKKLRPLLKRFKIAPNILERLQAAASLAPKNENTPQVATEDKDVNPNL